MELTYEDVKEGSGITPLVKNPGYVQLVKWANAQGNLGETHYDRDFAKASGLEDVILQGPLLGSFLGQAVEEWAGHVGRIRRYTWRNQNMAYPGDTLTVTGTVAKKWMQDGEGLVECAVELRSQRDDVIVAGTCAISLPLKTPDRSSA